MQGEWTTMNGMIGLRIMNTDQAVHRTFDYHGVEQWGVVYLRKHGMRSWLLRAGILQAT